MHRHKILLIEGARQIGKTYIIRKVSKELFPNYIEINFVTDAAGAKIFENVRSVEDFYFALSTVAGDKMKDRDSTIVFLDEIQECPRALTSLKYFRENAPQYDIIVAGSLLGVACHEGTGFPVGKVSFMNLYPLSFEEFLLAMGEERFVELLHNKDFKTIKLFNNKYEKLLKQYCYIGGMPEVVNDFIENELKNIRKVE